MPLLDHFHPPLSDEWRWESFLSTWATAIAEALTNRGLPPNYTAREHVHLGPTVAAGGAKVTPVVAQRWVPPAADGALQSVVPATFEVRVLGTDTAPRLAAVIKLACPGNKDRLAELRAFATKCASYLYQGISVIIVDIVTNHRADLHNEMLRVMETTDELQLPPESSLYAVAYRPLRRGQRDEIDLWRSTLALGQALPTLPLGLADDLVIPVDFEATYVEACTRKRPTGS